MLSRCHIQRSSGSTIIGSGEMSRNPVLNDKKMDISKHVQPQRYELTHTPDTHIHPVYPVLYSFSKNISFPFSKHSHHFKEIILPKQGSIIAIKGGYPTKFFQ
jgi:hypothetical protein